MYASVIVDIVHSSVDRIFEYRVPDGMKLCEGFRVRVPFGKGNALREGYVLALSPTCQYEGDNIKDIASAISDFAALTGGQIRLAGMIKRHYHTTLAAALRLMFPAEMRGGRVRDRLEREISYSLTDQEFNAFADTLKTKTGRIKAPRQMQVLELMREHGRLSAGRLERLLPGSASARDALLKRGALAMQKVESLRSPKKLPPLGGAFDLSQDQKNAVAAILAQKGKYLLHGVTGSGKTEVYIRIVQDCLRRGRSAIVLVPEISLTPQLVAMFTRSIGQDIAVYHSTLSAGERYDEWKRMITGRARVVIGARSAVFAPLRDIGAIIIDEEHENSYRSDTHPRYTAHEVARMRANIEGATLVLASATPSVESYIKAKNGIYRLVSMPNRLFGLTLPQVIVADMRREIVAGNRTIFSGVLYNEMKTALSVGRQVMLFINRRGFSTFVMCRGCGFVEYCDSCAVTMTYHASGDRLVCHYCGRSRPLRSVCPECGKKYLKQFGIGTQQVEAYVKRYFPQARVLRMDLDTTRGAHAHAQIYERFKNGEADVLIGTQMIAKGLDFENVSLVGVVAADASLMIPDYRSPERTFQLLEQVAGRAGRKDPGKVIVQTYSPDHYAVALAARHDFEGFFEQEMRLRKSALLPPYSVFFRIVFTGRSEDAVRAACLQDFEKGLQEAVSDMGNAILMLEAGEAPVKKIQGNARWQILVKVINDQNLAQFRKKLYIYQDTKNYRDCAFGVEINPQSMM